jgi:hypothetical protein
MSRDIAIVAGAIGRANVGGKAWVYLQYLLGLQTLGLEPVYLEDAGDESWVYDWERERLTTNLDYPARYVADSLASVGVDGPWMYRAGDETRGLGVEEMTDLCQRARLLIVVGDPITWRREYLGVRRRVFVDVDPGFTQWRLVNGDAPLAEMVAHAQVVFTVGLCVGSRAAAIPGAGRTWFRTVPPVSVTHWPATPAPDDAPFTAVMDWRGFRDVEYAGELYGQKDREFPAFLDLPARTRQPMLLAINGAPTERVTSHGWRAVAGWEASRTARRYAEFIRRSRAEFGIAKHGYVKSRGGWFSDRTVCYLASGKPVLLQDTGFSEHLPCGLGIVPFTDRDSALDGIEAINERYDDHARAARRLAEDVFDARRVLPRFLERAL